MIPLNDFQSILKVNLLYRINHNLHLPKNFKFSKVLQCFPFSQYPERLQSINCTIFVSTRIIIYLFQTQNPTKIYTQFPKSWCQLIFQVSYVLYSSLGMSFNLLKQNLKIQNWTREWNCLNFHFFKKLPTSAHLMKSLQLLYHGHVIFPPASRGYN